MAILTHHVPWYQEIFAIPGVLAEPMLIFGRQEVRVPSHAFPAQPGARGWRRSLARLGFVVRRHLRARAGLAHPDPHVSPRFDVPDLTGYMRERGLRRVDVLDLFDPAATLRHDMNRPVPPRYHGRYRCLIDIGCLEHLFDTWTCLGNCLRMLAVGGTYVLHTPVHGYFAHGLHVFNPEGLIGALELNGFSLLYKRYSSAGGVPLRRPDGARDVLIWLVARKRLQVEELTVPQQGYWREYYRRADPAERRRLQRHYWSGVG